MLVICPEDGSGWDRGWTPKRPPLSVQTGLEVAPPLLTEPWPLFRHQRAGEKGQEVERGERQTKGALWLGVGGIPGARRREFAARQAGGGWSPTPWALLCHGPASIYWQLCSGTAARNPQPLTLSHPFGGLAGMAHVLPSSLPCPLGGLVPPSATLSLCRLPGQGRANSGGVTRLRGQWCSLFLQTKSVLD